MPNDEQKDLAQFAADRGVDIVLGHHPHVLQPAEWVEGKDGDETYVIYSLENFLSGQYEHYRRIGRIAKLTIKQTITEDEEAIEVVDPQFMPTYVHDQDENNYEVIPMYQLSNKKLKDAEKHYEEIKEHMGQWMPELKFLEERSEEHTSELQSRGHLVCRLLLEKKKQKKTVKKSRQHTR